MRPYIIVSAIIFLVLALINLGRLIFNWPMQVGSCVVPRSASIIPIVVTAALIVWAVVVAKRPRTLL
jgi:hypothetical protein